ncbi:MAG: malic enzyme-like NAD(P)-binding protein, partial [Planctomycetota bacterium]
NNSLGFPGILKGALIVRARKITDNMAVAAAESVAQSAEDKGLSPQYIIPKMDEAEVFPTEAAAVAMQAVEDGVARLTLSREEVFAIAEKDILEAQKLTRHLMDEGYIQPPPVEILEEARKKAIEVGKAAVS